MVMRPDPRTGALTRVRYRPMGPWWLWALVVILAGIAAYAGYIARFSNERLATTEAVRSALAVENDQFKADLVALKRALDKARERGAKSRADAEAVSALVAKQQRRLTALQSELDTARADASEMKIEAERLRAEAAEMKRQTEPLRAEAASAKTAFAQVRKLQDHIAILKAEVEAAQAETAKSKAALERLSAQAAQAADAKFALEREVADLKTQLGELQQKLDAAATAAAQTAP